MSLESAFEQMAKDEGSAAAIAALEKIRDALETVGEVGDAPEREWAAYLMNRVSAAFTSVCAN